MSASRGAILLDIEGTTTPITFVSDMLFPYARRALRAYVDAHLDDAHVREAVDQLRDAWQHDAAREDKPPAWRDDDRAQRVASIVAYAEWLMDRDRKATGLKALQGHIWASAYADGSLRGDVYPDVPDAFARWHTAGVPIAIFSSGSVLAQQLLFRSTPYGDLTRFLRGYFDTTVGAKRSAESYRRIASALGCAPAQVLFVSDISAELEAAREAGCDTRLCVRDAPAKPAEPTPAAFPVVHDFTDLE